MNLIVGIAVIYAAFIIGKFVLRHFKRCLLALFFIGCGGNPTGEPFVAGTTQACMPNQTQECACPGGVKGAQACLEDGSGWDKCHCSGEVVGAAGGTSDSGSPAAVQEAAVVVKPQCGGTCDAPSWSASTCFLGCSALFSGQCTGTCHGSCDGESVDGNCPGKCAGTCTGQAVGNCGATCVGKFAGKCTGTCHPT